MNDLPLSTLQICNIDYESDVLKVKFEALSKWTLKRLIASFNDSNKKTHDFGANGVESRGLFNAIHVKFEVSDMNIMFYSALEKVFYLEIHYSTDGANKFRDLISL